MGTRGCGCGQRVARVGGPSGSCCGLERSGDRRGLRSLRAREGRLCLPRTPAHRSGLESSGRAECSSAPGADATAF
eukprot:1795759-Prymnesium_polylepis.2